MFVSSKSICSELVLTTSGSKVVGSRRVSVSELFRFDCFTLYMMYDAKAIYRAGQFSFFLLRKFDMLSTYLANIGKNNNALEIKKLLNCHFFLLNLIPDFDFSKSHPVKSKNENHKNSIIQCAIAQKTNKNINIHTGIPLILVYRSYRYTVHTGIPFIPVYRSYRYTVHTGIP